MPKPSATAPASSAEVVPINKYVNGTIGIELPWEKLIQDFRLSSDRDWLNITAKINIIEQVGYG
jgi:hypothetical protein